LPFIFHELLGQLGEFSYINSFVFEEIGASGLGFDFAGIGPFGDDYEIGTFGF
jgi:hypothetical protein